jgi:hypothetical protein
MRIVGDVLDKDILDRNGRPLGRVDGIEVELRHSREPRVTNVLLGATVLGQRISRRAGWWAAAVERLYRPRSPVRIPFGRISLTTDARVRADVTLGETGADALEHAARRVVVRLPGAQR